MMTATQKQGHDIIKSNYYIYFKVSLADFRNHFNYKADRGADSYTRSKYKDNQLSDFRSTNYD